MEAPAVSGPAPRPTPPLVLRPVMGLVDRLRVGVRLVASALVLMVPAVVATWSYAGVVTGQVAFTGSERDGVEVLRPALQAMAAVVAGDPVDLGPLQAAMSAHPDLVPAQTVQALVAAVPQEAADADARAELAARLVDVITEVGDQSNLILDPDLDSFYVMDALVVAVPGALLSAAQSAVPARGTEQADLVGDQAVRAGALSSVAVKLRGDLAAASRNTERAGLQDRLDPLVVVADEASAMAGRLSATLERPGPVDATELARAAAAAVGPAAAELDALLAQRQSGFVAARTLTLTVTLAGLLLAGWLIAAVWWRIRSDVGMALHGMTALARGDFGAQPMPAGRDEFGDIGRALTRTRMMLQRQTDDLVAAQALREQESRAAAEEQRRGQQEAAEAAQTTIRQTSEEIVADLAALTERIEGAREAVGTIDERVRATDEVVRAVSAQATTAIGIAEQLGERLREVSGMAQLISSVAEQTKLLALNATIEAARAGEAGRGFTVVAGEVNDLASTTDRSTVLITNTVESLERDALQMIQAIQGIGERVTGLDRTTEVLGRVAAGQYAVVEELATTLQGTMGRVSGLAAVDVR